MRFVPPYYGGGLLYAWRLNTTTLIRSIKVSEETARESGGIVNPSQSGS